MNKNNYNQHNNKKSVIILGVIALFVLFVGWAMLKAGNGPAAGGQTTNAGDLNSFVGRTLPTIQLFDKDSKPYSLDGLKGKNAVLFFNEGIMCYPACWNQVAAFGTDQRFNNQDTVALSVVVASPQDWQQAMAKMPDLANAPILFDQNSAVSRQLNLLSLASSMHKGAIPGHTYIVLDKQGIVRFVYDDPKMAINNDLLNQKIQELKN